MPLRGDFVCLKQRLRVHRGSSMKSAAPSEARPLRPFVGGWVRLGWVVCGVGKVVKAQARYPLPSRSSPSLFKAGSGTSGTDFGA